MGILLDHILPVALMLGGIAVCFVLEFLLRKGILLKGRKEGGTVSSILVGISLLIGAGMMVYLTVIGAGLEIMLPVILFILLGAMI